MGISVVIPVYNRPQSIITCVESVINQSQPVDEIIIVNDGSNDATANSIETLTAQHPAIIRSIQQSNRGVSSARNEGIQHAKHEWIALLDSDDKWLAHKIATFKEHLQQHPECLVFHSNEIWIRNGVRVNAMKKHQKRGGMIFKHCLPLCVISPSAVIIHKQIFDTVGLFDEQLPACEDYDLWLRICHNTPICYVDEALINKFGGHEDQLSRKYWGMDRFRIHALNKLLTQADLTAENQVMTTAMLCKKLNILLKGAKKHNNSAIIEQFEPLIAHYDCK